MEKQFRFVYFIHNFVKNRITKKNCYSEKKKNDLRKTVIITLTLMELTDSLKNKKKVLKHIHKSGAIGKNAEYK